MRLPVLFFLLALFVLSCDKDEKENPSVQNEDQGNPDGQVTPVEVITTIPFEFTTYYSYYQRTTSDTTLYTGGNDTTLYKGRIERSNLNDRLSIYYQIDAQRPNKYLLRSSFCNNDSVISFFNGWMSPTLTESGELIYFEYDCVGAQYFNGTYTDTAINIRFGQGGGIIHGVSWEIKGVKL